MNFSTAVMLINTNIKAVKTIYQPDTDKIKQPRVIYKTLDKSIKPGDYVVVPTSTRHGMTVVLVDEVDVEVDFEDPTEIRWIVDKVSAAEHAAILIEEQRWISEIVAAEKNSKREELKKKMFDMYQSVGMEKMPIAFMSDSNVLEDKREG